MSSDSEEDTAGPSTPKKCKKSKHRPQKYRTLWESEGDFKDWIGPDKNNVFRAHCKLCDVKISCETSTLKRHMSNSEHLRKIKNVKVFKPIDSFFKKTDRNVSHENSVAELELKLCSFMAEHNISYQTMDHLSEILKCIPDSKIAADIKLKRTKCTNVIKNVIGECHKSNLETLLKSTKFSVLVDESTDISSVKTMCIVVRLYDPETERISSLLWELRPIFEKDDFDAANQGATGAAIYDSIIKSFQDRNVPISNIIGYASDGASVMMGQNNSVASRFMLSNPGIIILKCICHSLHLCASEACKKLPRRCEDLARNVYGFFKNSHKRQSEFVEFQVFTNTKVHKMLHPSQTRWLSLLAVVNRLLEQWDSLKLFFTKKWLEERIVSSELIFNDLNDPFMKLYFLFLQWVLPKFVNLNEYFQKSGVAITELDRKMRATYQELLLSYMKRDYIVQNDLDAVDPTKEECFLSADNMYFGVQVMTEIANPNIQSRKDLILDFQKRSRSFLVAGCCQIKNRYDFSDVFLQKLSIFLPKNAVAHAQRSTEPTLLPIMMKVPCIMKDKTNEEKQAIDDEWRRLPSTVLPEDSFSNIETMSPDEFWSKMLNFPEPLFRNLAKFVLEVLSLPHANADSERIFSAVNLIKTKQRNRLLTSTINGTLLTKQCISRNFTDCTRFKPSPDMIAKIKKPSEDATDVTLSNIVDLMGREE